MIRQPPISARAWPLSEPSAPGHWLPVSARNPMLRPLRQPWSFPLALVFLLWIILFFGPDFWLAANGVSLGRKVPNYLYGLLAGLVLARAPAPSKATWSLP